MIKFSKALGYIVAALVGVAVVILIEMKSTSVQTSWIKLRTEIWSDEMSPTYSEAAIKQRLIYHAPELSMWVTQGEGKFIEQDPPGKFSLGYKFSISLDDIDKSQLSEEYLREKNIDIGGGKVITRLPAQQFDYDIKFLFKLKDKDGFTILEMEGENHDLAVAVSGTKYGNTSTSFQGVSPRSISASTAARVKSITYKLWVDKCINCNFLDD
jgi:hypothetical protein